METVQGILFLSRRAWRQRCRWAIPALCLWGASALPAPAQVLELEPRAMVSGARILLQDLVRAGTSLPDGWGTRSIADAPAPRETKALSLTEVAQTMNAYDDMQNVVLRGRPVIQVSAKHQAVNLDRLQQAVDDYVQRHDEWKGRRFEVVQGDVDMPQVPEGRQDLVVIQIAPVSEAGKTLADVRVVVDGQTYGKGVQVGLTEMHPFWSATRPLARGETLTADAVEKRWISEPDAARFYPANVAVVGMELRRSLQAGQILAAGMLAQPVCARRGEMVQVLSHRGGLTVSLRARALSDGRRDEHILCVNEQSGRKMQVRLVQPRSALLEDEPGGPQT